VAARWQLIRVNVVSVNISAATKRLILKGLLILIFNYFKCPQRYCTVAPDQEPDDPGRTMVFRSGWNPFQGARHG
jgi:hypothetical protein